MPVAICEALTDSLMLSTLARTGINESQEPVLKVRRQSGREEFSCYLELPMQIHVELIYLLAKFLFRKQQCNSCHFKLGHQTRILSRERSTDVE